MHKNEIGCLEKLPIGWFLPDFDVEAHEDKTIEWHVAIEEKTSCGWKRRRIGHGHSINAALNNADYGKYYKYNMYNTNKGTRDEEYGR